MSRPNHGQRQLVMGVYDADTVIEGGAAKDARQPEPHPHYIFRRLLPTRRFRSARRSSARRVSPDRRRWFFRCSCSVIILVRRRLDAVWTDDMGRRVDSACRKSQ